MTKLFNYISAAFLFLFACTFNFAAYADATIYKFVDLGLQESDQSEAVAVNDNGQVAGMYWMLGKKYYFMWTENEGITLIDLPETANITVLNNSGQLAGSYKDFNNKDRGFIWDAKNGFSDIGTLGGSFTRVYDMNDFGNIVGESESANVSLVDGRPEWHAFIWQNGSMIDLGALAGDLGVLGDRSKATSINNRGEIIGTSNSLIAHKRKFLRTNDRAVFWQEFVIESIGGIWQDFVIEEVDSNLDPQYSAEAISVNNAGIATFGSNNNEYFAINLADKSKILFSINNFSTPFEVTDANDIFVIHPGPAIYLGFLKSNNSKEYSFGGSFYDYIYFQFALNSPWPWKPNSFTGACYNNKRWVVGQAQNIYGERHAALLIPIEVEVLPSNKKLD